MLTLVSNMAQRVNEMCHAYYIPWAYITFPYICKLYHIYRLLAYYGNLQGLSFKEASAISGCFQSRLEKCCLQPQPECIM